MKTDLFQYCGHCWVFQICWPIEFSTLTASSFRILNSSSGIPSPPPLFIVMLPKAYLTSHSRMSGSRWVIMPLWLSKSLRPFLYSFPVCSCLLFLISSASLGSCCFCPLFCLSDDKPYFTDKEIEHGLVNKLPKFPQPIGIWVAYFHVCHNVSPRLGAMRLWKL